MDNATAVEAEVSARLDGHAGRLTLNRPSALHALTTGMCLTMNEALQDWAEDPAVRMVVIDHRDGTRGFCAGGDIRAVARSGRSDGQAAAEFFAAEYALNVRIKRFPKPFVAIMDGIVMGGGAGVSVHGSHCIVTENTVFAMPETGIGLFPDVGGGWFLPRLAGELGTWLALTGARLTGADVVAAGIGTHFVPSERLADLKAELVTSRDVEATLARFARPVGPLSFTEHLEVMNRCFSKPTVTDICIALKLEEDEWAYDQSCRLASRSPTSMSVTLRHLREGARMDSFEDVMRMEYRIACNITRSHDFIEGVRAVLEDKDNRPRWSPQSLAAVSPEAVSQMFAPVASELAL